MVLFMGSGDSMLVPACLVLPLLLQRMVLFKMLNKGLFNEINGCVSTGKEANVYHASTGDGTDLAIKVYKTSILVFKDRDRWVRGCGGRGVPGMHMLS
jgi:hypothetical protein